MNYTTIAPWKAEEKELSEKLYKKLQGLMLLQPPSDDFRKCCTEEMFLKPNQHAFFQVMHYLYKLHDPIEFRKRFYWPVIDKKAEANFRASTVEYLKYLNEKHNLRWNNVKSYLVVMPGGMKFIKFLLDFVSFIIQEQIKHREKYLSAPGAEISVDATNLKRMRMQNMFLKKYASEFIREVSNHIVMLQDKTKSIKLMLTQMSKSISFDLNDILSNNDDFLKAFEADNTKLFEQNFNLPITDIDSVQKLLANLKDAMDLFQFKESELKIDKNAVQQKIKQLFPTGEAVNNEELEVQAAPHNALIKIDSLISAFNCIYPIIEEQLFTAKQMPRCSDFVIKELTRLKSELQHIELQTTDFQKKINVKKNQYLQTPARRVNGNLISSNNENILLSKFVATPPIKLEMQEPNLKRLPFLDDCHLNVEHSMIASTTAGMESFNNLLALSRSHRKQKSPNKSMEQLSTLHKSKIIDPMELLRTIQKDTAKVKSLPRPSPSTSETTWKERQIVFGNNMALPTLAESPLRDRAFSINLFNSDNEQSTGATLCNETLIPVSPFTPLNSNERTRIARQQILETSAIVSKKPSAVKKVQDASLNFQNLSTSPSGRLEPLVNMEPLVSMEAHNSPPKLLVNDVCVSEDLRKEDNKENLKSMNHLQNEISNISDGVIRDITM